MSDDKRHLSDLQTGGFLGGYVEPRLGDKILQMLDASKSKEQRKIAKLDKDEK